MDAIYKKTLSGERTHAKQNHYKIDWMIKRFKHLFKKHVWYCDIGVGDGYGIQKVAPLVCSCAAVEQSMYLCQYIKHKTIPVRVEDWQPKNIYGVITAFDILEHTGCVEAALANIRKALAGDLLITIPFNENLANRETQCPICKHVFHSVGHNHSWTVPTFTYLLQSQGFRIVETGLVPVYLSKNKVLNWTANVGLNMLEPETFTRTLFVRAK